MRGELRIWPDNPATESLFAGATLRLGGGGGPEQTFEIENARRDAQGPVVRLRGVASRDAAAALTGRIWYEARESFAPLGEDEFYVADLVGLEACTESGQKLGRIRDVWNFGGGDILVVGAGPDEHLVPFAGGHTLRVDALGGRVIVRLTDLDETESPPRRARRSRHEPSEVKEK